MAAQPHRKPGHCGQSCEWWPGARCAQPRVPAGALHAAAPQPVPHVGQEPQERGPAVLQGQGRRSVLQVNNSKVEDDL